MQLPESMETHGYLCLAERPDNIRQTASRYPPLQCRLGIKLLLDRGL